MTGPKSAPGCSPASTCHDRHAAAFRPRPDKSWEGEPVRVLVIGGGGREHALCLALAADPAVTYLAASPGNPGIAEVAQLLDSVSPLAAARAADADLVVVGPEAPLVAGAADEMREAGFAVFGPSAAAAQLEGSKAFAKQVMADAGVPTAGHWVCAAPGPPAAAPGRVGPPYVVKHDEL